MLNIGREEWNLTEFYVQVHVYIYVCFHFFMLENYFIYDSYGKNIKCFPYLNLNMYEECMCTCISYLNFKSVTPHCCSKFYNKVYSGDWSLTDALVYSIVLELFSIAHDSLGLTLHKTFKIYIDCAISGLFWDFIRTKTFWSLNFN